MNLTDRLITAIVEKCDGLSITAEQASNILAYLQYGATMDTTTTNTGAGSLSDEQIEKGWRDTFSTDNPYCPCNLKSFTKAVRWAERHIAATRQADAAPSTVTLDRRDLFDFVRGGIKAALEDGKAGEGMVASWYWQEATERAEHVLGNLGIFNAAIAAGGAQEAGACLKQRVQIGSTVYEKGVEARIVIEAITK